MNVIFINIKNVTLKFRFIGVTYNTFTVSLCKISRANNCDFQHIMFDQLELTCQRSAKEKLICFECRT